MASESDGQYSPLSADKKLGDGAAAAQAGVQIEAWNLAIGEEDEFRNQYEAEATALIRQILAAEPNRVPFNISNLGRSLIFGAELQQIMGAYRQIGFGEIEAPLLSSQDRHVARNGPESIKAALMNEVARGYLDMKKVSEAITAIRRLRSIINAVRRALTTLSSDTSMKDSSPVINAMLNGTNDRAGLNSDTLKAGMGELKKMDVLLTEIVRSRPDWQAKLAEPQGVIEDF